MGDMAEVFNEWKEHKKAKKNSNLANAIAIFTREGIKFKEHTCHHWAIGDFDYWPSTGLFMNRKTKKRGRGIYKLLSIIKPVK